MTPQAGQRAPDQVWQTLRCPTCARSVCGMHSWLVAGRRLCRTDACAAQKVQDGYLVLADATFTIAASLPAVLT